MDNHIQTNTLVHVSVKTRYLMEQSSPNDHQYLWAYEIHITNNADYAVQLLRRYWLITDGLGNKYDVEGEGVVGEQPIIQPQSHYKYISACPLTTSHGMMKGHYIMQNKDGEVPHPLFKVDIPIFVLDIEGQKPQFHS